MNYEKFSHYKQKAFENCSLRRSMFFAFSNKQFEEGCAQVHARKNKRRKWLLTRIPGGGFLTHDATATWNAFWANWNRYENKFRNDDKYIIDGLVYEYGNHEAQYGMGGKQNAEENFPQATQDQKDRAWRTFSLKCLDEDLI